MDEHLVGNDAVQAPACLNFGSEKDVKEASKQQMDLRKNVMGCLRNREKKANDVQVRFLDGSSQSIFCLRLLCFYWRNAMDGCLALTGIWKEKGSIKSYLILK